jgi:phosphoribosylglycinamide formyltransferase-1
LQMKRIAILASGEGTNAENLINYFRTSNSGRVVLVLTNKPGAGVIARARTLEVETVVFDREQFYQTGGIVALLQERGVDFIVLAGFLWLVPSQLLKAYEGRVINIHPALLPKYGGKGMYGDQVHKSVIASGDRESGITIHHVNQAYDEGDIIFQARCPVEEGDTPGSLAARIHALEYHYYPVIIEGLLDQL